MYIKGLVNTKDQSNACMCEMMSKGSKEALTVLIVTHVIHVKRVERLHYVHNIHLMLCRKGRKIIYVETREKHIFAHNFLNIQPIFNPFQPYHPMLCMSKGSKVILTFDPFDML